MADDPVVTALRTAMAASDSAELRAALADHLLLVLDPGQALREAEVGLSRFPAAPVLLAAAARAARAAGQAPRAAAYELAANALQGSSASAAPGPSSFPATSEDHPDAADDPDRRVAAAREGGRTARLRLVTEQDAPAESALTFADVAGLDELKARLDRSFLAPLRDPELHRRFGKKVGGGLLLYGPPGCGKTFVARALAGELGARFTAVGLTDVLDMWLGAERSPRIMR